MTTDNDNAVEVSARAVLQLLATINDRTKEIYWILRKNSAIAEVTQACDPGRSSDFMTGQEEYCFEVYVDATTRSDESFCWHVDVTLRSNGWELERRISTPTHQRDVDVRFEEITFATFDELAASCSALLDEFIESARTFDFDHPYGTIAGSTSA
jgi:hypothetical protein